jgi:hypothetical protein
MSSRHIGGFLFLMLATVRISAAQVIVNSVFTPQYSDNSYSNPANWSPPEVPNNSPAKNYSVTIRSQAYLDIDATVSNLLIDSTVLLQQNHSFTVTGTTTIIRGSQTFPFENIRVYSFNSSGASFVTDSLSTFSGGVLGGGFALWAPNPTSGSAILQFHGADVRTLTGNLSLSGPLTRVIDEAGNDGLRSLSRIEAEATLALAGHQMSVVGPFTNDGQLLVNSDGNQPGLFAITGELTNFDPSTHTLKNGTYSLGGVDDFGTNQPATLQFPGADIVHNGGGIFLGDPLAKIVDENGSDALRNFSHITATGFFGISGFSFTKAGDFTNDGTLTVYSGTLTLQGNLTNFDPVTHTLTGGSYQLFQGYDGLAASLVFTDADIQNNAASIYLYKRTKIRDQNGNDALRNFAHNLPGASFLLFDYFDFVAPGDFTNSGEVTIQSSFSNPQPHFVMPKNHRYVQTEGTTHLWGAAVIGDMEINGGSFDTAASGPDNIPAVLDGNLAVGDALFTPNGLVVHGAAQLSAGSTFSTRGDSDSGFIVNGGITVAGTLQIAEPQVPPPSTATFFVVQSGGTSISGTFSNAPNGARIPTIDGLGSFVVSYNSFSISISGFQALPATAHLLNISTRGPVGTGENVMVGGFIVTGTQSKRVIVRALGPSLPSLLGTLPDPVLELHDSSGGLIASNDNWRTDQEADIIATGVRPSNDFESAIVATLQASNSAYTAIVRGADDRTGIGLVEVYDLDRAADSKMANISTRGVVATGDRNLIGGLLVLNQNSTRVIVRALGPSVPVSGRLSDPTLSLYDSNGALVAFNDNWRTDQEGEIIATGIPPGNDLDAAIVTTFPALGGSYTTVVKGKDGATGVALVEVYDLSH